MPTFLGIDDNVLQKKILPNAMRAGLEPTFVNAFSKGGVKNSNGGDMGSRNAVIHRETVQSGDGLTYVVPLIRELDYNDRIYDNEEVTGNEQDISLYSDTVGIRSMDTAIRLGYRERLKLATPTKIESYLTSLTSTAVRRGLEWDIWRASSIGAYAPDPNNIAASLALNKPVYDRIVVSAAAQPTRNAYNAYAGVTALCAGSVQNVVTLNVGTLDLMKRYAEEGGAAPEAEDIISAPETYISSGIRADEYIAFIDPICVAGLFADARWLAQQNRGVVVKDAPQAITGSKMLGMLDGIRVYSNPWLAKFRFTNVTGTYAWNILCGAGAIHLGTYKPPAFHYKEEDYNKQYGITLREFRGQKALVYPSKTTPGAFAEYGIIHNLTRVL